MASRVCCIILVVLVMVAGFAESDLDKDKQECANQLVGDTALLHLAPNSPESKVFDDFTKSASNTTATTTAGPTGNEPSADVKSEGGKGQRWLGVEAISVAITGMAVHAFFCGFSLI